MIKKKKFLALVLAVVMVVGLMAACGGGGDAPAPAPSPSPAPAPAAPSGDAPASIKIGIPNPYTGPLAGFGEGTPWAENLVIDAVNAEGGIYIEEYDAYLPLEAIYVDTQSDATIAGEVTQQLITNDQVDILIARHTPGTALPVSAMAENMGVPFVSLECPVNPWLAGGPYEWGYHSFWMVEDNCEMFMDMWEELGYGPGTVVGGIFPNDPDGLAWKPIFEEKLPQRGFVLSDPGITEMMQNDWTNVVNKFIEDGVQIVTGVPITPDFANFAAAAVQLGLDFEIATMGRAYLFPSDAMASPTEVIPRLTNEVWWSPWHPWTSSIDGMTAMELAMLYEAEFGKGWSAPMGYKYAGVEIAVDALRRAASLDPVAIRDAIGATDLNTMVGHIKYDPVTHVALTDIVGGQWFLNDNGEAELQIVYNANNPHIPKNGELHIPGR
ncbi:MAG: ABC transporter substrate-binding protein [Clostridiales bacterium]|nr:ABC transporter substrate-binding protein [Clostridiales bacterium]